MSLVRYDPFRELEGIQARLNHADEFINNSETVNRTSCRPSCLRQT